MWSVGPLAARRRAVLLLEHTLYGNLSENDRRLFQHLGAMGHDLGDPVRMAGGRTNRVWHSGSIVVKLYHTPHTANPLFENDFKRECAALRALSRTGMAPNLLDAGVFEEQPWLIYRHIAGEIWRSDPAKVARFLGRLHDYPCFSGLPGGVNGSEDLNRQTLRILGRIPEIAQPVFKLKPKIEVPPTSKRALIHGDPVPGNLLVHDGIVTLIDWQCPQFGDPAEDLALFLSPAMQFLYRGEPLTEDEEKAFLSAYPNWMVVERYQNLKPWFHWRMAAYCLWRSTQGDVRDMTAAQLEIQALKSCSAKSA